MKILYVFNTLIIECSTFLLIRPLLKLVFSICLDFVYGQKGGEKEDTIGEALKANTFFYNIKHIYLQVQETLNKSQEMYEARHDHHRTKKIIQSGR